MKYSDQQIDLIADSMASGIHGSFARAIAEALMIADSTNQAIILKSFGSLFSRVASFLDIAPSPSFSDAFIAKHMSALDKKLYQGHISQDEYESMVKALKEATA
jgi:hypothetical protein